MKYLIVPIDKSSVSFCYYDNPYRTSGQEPIALDILQRTVDYAQANELTINFLYGRNEPPEPHCSLIKSVSHAAFVPLALADAYPESVVVIESGEIEQAAADKGLRRSPERNVIVRLGRERLPRLANDLPLLFGTFQRLNLYLTGLENITESELELYGQQLAALTETVADCYRRGDIFELNVLSDRMILDNMRNCEAGCEHCTVGPDGQLYLCPGFLYDDPGAAIGSLAKGIQIPNAELLCLDHAPLCSSCDAFHCKRCIYLNKKLTLEINTPSRQQCVASYKERNASEQLLTLLRDLPVFSAMKLIPSIDYCDPFEVRHQLKKTSGDRQEEVPPKFDGSGRSIEEILVRICRIQEEILELLKRDR
ncbi:MAG: CXXX repeat peptide maturase [Chitinispirillaceae bacterium]|jgi:CXXX repeat peptide maturase